MGLPVACGIGNIAILAHAFAGTLRGRAQAEAADAVPLPEHRGVAPPSRRKVGARRAGVARRRRDRGHLFPVRRRAADPGAGDRHLRCQRSDADARHGPSPATGPATCRGPRACPAAIPSPCRADGSISTCPQASIARRRSRGMPATRRKTGWWWAPTVVPAIRAGCTTASRRKAPTSQPGSHVGDLEQVWQAMSAPARANAGAPGVIPACGLSVLCSTLC